MPSPRVNNWKATLARRRTSSHVTRITTALWAASTALMWSAVATDRTVIAVAIAFSGVLLMHAIRVPRRYKTYTSAVKRADDYAK